MCSAPIRCPDSARSLGRGLAGRTVLPIARERARTQRVPRRSRMLRALPLCLLVAAAPVTQWKAAHPEAAQALREWARKDPTADRKLFAWDGLHPEQTKALVDWAIDKRDGDVI